MMYQTMNLDEESRGRGAAEGTLYLTADNCGGQNKNRFFLWFLSWITLIGKENRVKLALLVAGHTKNACDGGFGLVKRRLKKG